MELNNQKCDNVVNSDRRKKSRGESNDKTGQQITHGHVKLKLAAV